MDDEPETHKSIVTMSRSLDGTWQGVGLNPSCLVQEATFFVVYIKLKYAPIKQEYTFSKDDLPLNMSIKHITVI